MKSDNDNACEICNQEHADAVPMVRSGVPDWKSNPQTVRIQPEIRQLNKLVEVFDCWTEFHFDHVPVGKMIEYARARCWNKLADELETAVKACALAK